MPEVRNGRNQELAYGRLDADALYIMDHVEGLIESMKVERESDSTSVGEYRHELDAQIGILSQIVEVAYDRNALKGARDDAEAALVAAAKIHLHALTLQLTNEQSAMRQVVDKLLADENYDFAAWRLLQIAVDRRTNHQLLEDEFVAISKSLDEYMDRFGRR